MKGAQFKFRDVECPTLEVVPDTFKGNADGSKSFSAIQDFLTATKNRDRLQLTVFVYPEFVEAFPAICDDITAQHDISNYVCGEI